MPRGDRYSVMLTCYQDPSLNSVHLLWEETAGGALGPHGVGLEQRMFVVPGLYLVKPLDYFEGAHEGSLAFEGTDKVRVYIPKHESFMRSSADSTFDRCKAFSW